MASEETMALTAITMMMGTVLGGPCVLLWLCNRGPNGEK